MPHMGECLPSEFKLQYLQKKKKESVFDRTPVIQWNWSKGAPWWWQAFPLPAQPYSLPPLFEGLNHGIKYILRPLAWHFTNLLSQLEFLLLCQYSLFSSRQSFVKVTSNKGQLKESFTWAEGADRNSHRVRRGENLTHKCDLHAPLGNHLTCWRPL
jgi:hypothetical protein